MKRSSLVPLFLGAVFLMNAVYSQESSAVFTPIDVPVSRVVLFSSGVAYFEHAGRVTGNALLSLPFRLEDVNDALKSLTVNDPGAAPVVSYPSEETLDRSLKSLKIDLSGKPTVAAILDSLRGAEITVQSTQNITGRIMGVETRYEGEQRQERAFLSLFTRQGIKVIALDEAAGFAFSDTKLNEDLNRALDIIFASTDMQSRNLSIRLSGREARPVSIGYVIPSPVWKASYRIDLTTPEKAFLQGWAIIDNAGDLDWKNVRLSLVTGRPVSFIQNLFQPLYIQRPIIPLSIAGFAQARTYDSGFGAVPMAESADRAAAAPAMAQRAKSLSYDEMEAESYYSGGAPSPAPSVALAASSYNVAESRSAGDQFEFTVRAPVTLDRRQSAMIPLIETTITAEKVSIYSAGGGRPMLGARLTNSTGMKLPAGPITVFDDNTYAGDALIEFFTQNDKRIIAYGEDLQVNALSSTASAREVTAVSVARGVMTITRRVTTSKTYTFKNSGAKNRKMLIEHAITAGTELFEPARFDEKTATLYRFVLDVPAGKEEVFTVRERQNVNETVALVQQRPETILAYSTSSEIPARVRAALERAVALKKAADDARQNVTVLQAQKNEKIAEQDRTRRNIDSVGRDSQQGREFLRKLTTSEAEIDQLNGQIESAQKAARDAQSAYETYLQGLTLEA